ncbi:MAG: acyl-CoA/acyl-ACP dehydrogenase, partial [Caldilineaceae bacterium]|nr:acyl-CoA/acyl-ACP dehydrogenase [Caldilineaceae bacterium]
PAANMLGRSDSSKPTTGGKVNAWFMLLIAAVYTGVAEAALTAAARYAEERVPTALGRPIATLDTIQRHLGEAQLKLHQARTMLYTAADLWDRFPDKRVDLGTTVGAAKVTSTNQAIAAVDHCMRVAGGASMTRALPLERFYRDVRGGLNHPINDDQALLLFGQEALREAAA